ncbi:putative nucleotide phosphatase [Vairimorpha necatrix]|uniref:Nucleotide phosphatase n=1 Tax=Vairimorpha necatrix TaxID=6039 RepID=A0AAX4JAY3_9MICR
MTTISEILKYITIHPDSLATYKDSLAVKKNEPVFIFDIDDTLYKMSSDMQKAEYKSWMTVFDHLNNPKITDKTFHEILNSSPMQGGGFYKLFEKTVKEAETLRGNFKYEVYLSKDASLREVLLDLKYKKYCFTNGSKSRSQSILRCLGLEDCFDGVVCIDDTEMGTRGKPFAFSYEFIIELLKIEDNPNIYFFDDSKFNIEKAKEYNWRCYKIEKDTNLVEIIKKINEDLKVAGER